MANVQHSATLAIGSRVAASWSQSVGAISGGTEKVKREIASLRDKQRGVAAALRETEAAASRMGVQGSLGVAHLTAAHTALKREQQAVEAELRAAQRSAARLGKSGSEDIRRLTTRLVQLEAEERDTVRTLDELTRSAQRFGVEGSEEVAKLRREHEKLSSTLEREGRRLKMAQAWHDLDVGGRTSGALRRIGAGLAEVGRVAAYTGAAVGAAAVGGVAWFTQSAIEAAASMETLHTSLTTVEGSSAKADRAMSWITDFAATTPYELGQVGEAFARLRAYGIDPTDGTLRILGDTASSMGKDVMSAVEMMADAVTGENERLKEFGIRASKSGDQITYFYKNAAGEDRIAKVKRNSQEAIRATLTAIFNEKYAGAMDRQSRTWRGLMSNLSDQWTQFQVRVMQGGVFDLLKGELEGLLANVNRWATDGTLEHWAQEIAGAYRWAFAQVREGFTWVRDNWPEIKRSFQEGYEVAKNVATWLYRVGVWARDAAGGADNLAMGIAAVGAAKVLAPLGSLVSVGWSIVSWLSRAVGLTGKLESGLSRAGGAMGGAVKGLGGRVAGGVAGMGGAMRVAGGVAGAAALGWGIGTLIDEGTEALTGKKLSTRIGESFSSEADRSRAAVGGVATRGGLGGMTSARAGSNVVQNNDNRQITVKVEGNADPDAVAEKVVRKLGSDMRSEQGASYGR